MRRPKLKSLRPLATSRLNSKTGGIMKEKIICLVTVICLGLAGAIDRTQAAEQSAPSAPVVKNGPNGSVPGTQQQGVYFEPLPDETFLPEMRDLPVPRRFKETTRKFTGIIKNRTSCDVQLPSGNSDATLTIPAHGWIEYISWIRGFGLTIYCDGKPYYCLNIHANPKAYPFMCKKYDFMAEIVKPEGVEGYPGKKLKRRVHKVKAVG